ncbi:MAG: DUF3021 domain-containing protein [Eubacterium sp.]|nr:DUF3021 domain-containing protein [Eubacterium sp.]
MKKKIFLRSISGFSLGLSIEYLITIILSLIWADGYYSPCVPELTVMMGSEIKAVLLQAFLCGLLGLGFGAGSIIWEIEKWGIVKQTGIYFLLTSLIMMPIAYLTYWMEHSVKGFLSYYGIFAFIFALIWVIQYIRYKYNVKRMNAFLTKQRQEEGE